MRGFENDFKRGGIDAGRGGENTLVLFVNDAVAGGEAVNGGVDVSGQYFTGLPESGTEQILSQGVAANESVNSLAGVIGVQLNDAVEMVGAKFVLEDFNFRFDRSVPEFAVKVAAAPRAARVIFETGGVANGIKMKEEILRGFGRGCQIEQEFGSGEGTGGFIA